MSHHFTRHMYLLPSNLTPWIDFFAIHQEALEELLPSDNTVSWPEPASMLVWRAHITHDHILIQWILAHSTTKWQYYCLCLTLLSFLGRNHNWFAFSCCIGREEICTNLNRRWLSQVPKTLRWDFTSHFRTWTFVQRKLLYSGASCQSSCT